MKHQTLLDFMRLFSGRMDRYFDSKQTIMRPERLTQAQWKGHLDGTHEIGVYPVTATGLCRWGCLDFDEKDTAATYARAAFDTLGMLGVRGHIESSRSKGFHVWWFFARPVPAVWVRALGLHCQNLAAEALAVERITNEVNPKSIDPRKTVNCVRIPYSGNANAGRMVFFDPGTGEQLSLADFTEAALADLTSPYVGRDVFHMLKAQEEARRASREGDGFDVRSFDPSGQHQGNVPGVLAGVEQVGNGERNNTFWTLVNYCHSLKMSESDCEMVVARVWDRQVPNKEGASLDEYLRMIRRKYR